MRRHITVLLTYQTLLAEYSRHRRLPPTVQSDNGSFTRCAALALIDQHTVCGAPTDQTGVMMLGDWNATCAQLPRPLTQQNGLAAKRVSVVTIPPAADSAAPPTWLNFLHSACLSIRRCVVVHRRYALTHSKSDAIAAASGRIRQASAASCSHLRPLSVVPEL
jgi:hypothetical protein